MSDEPYTRAFALFCKIMAHLHWIKNKITNFAASEGRNPRVKNAFLALSHKPKSPISKQRDEDNATLILFVYPTSTAHAVPYKVYTTAWGICFSVHFCNGVWRCLGL